MRLMTCKPNYSGQLINILKYAYSQSSPIKRNVKNQLQMHFLCLFCSKNIFAI